MSSHPRTASQPRLVPTNLRYDDVVWDKCGVKDSRYYCLPPDHTTSGTKKRTGGGAYLYHLVSQGHIVGIFDDWLEAKASLTGFPTAATAGKTQRKMDPAFVTVPTASASAFVNTSPHKSGNRPSSAAVVKRGGSPVKRETTPGPSGNGNAQLLADLKRYCSPICDDNPGAPAQAVEAEDTEGVPYVNFAIRGGGIISSSPEQRFRELQRRGEQPDMLVTRSFPLASLFALEEDVDEPN
ncbi:hypothetical protein B0H13DRAFT_2376107 [Mycena leptocephala]|nr:hypothetical protein B0H13DRAFT_2376107 [Mycena leptocephala]